MKNTTILFFGIVLFAILLISLFSSTVVVPYSKDTLFSNQYPYEGFTDKKKGVVDPKKVEGFEGLQSSPLGDEKPLDLYSKLSSSNTCEPGPYSNSTGFLCLDQKTKDLLMTRGGNQTIPPKM
jgi:hypothetical protein